jgi:glycosyltransferase involved in cell wall biosynthesis
MRIALDATPLTAATGGIRRYTVELARALAECAAEAEIHLLSDQPFELPADWPPGVIAGRPASGHLERRWWLWGLPARLGKLRVEVFHGTDFSVPYLPVVPAVVTIHDLSPWRNHAWQSGTGRVRQRTPLVLKLGLANMVITPSVAVRREVIEMFGLSPASVAAVPLAAARQFRPVAGASPERPYFLCVGTLEPRKNIGRIVEAWRAVHRRHDVELWLAGRRREDAPSLAEEPGLRWLGTVPDSDLPALYSGARAVLYPSLYEGFGLPVLEGMSCGAAVLASGLAPVREFGENAAVLLDPDFGGAWTEAMEAALTNPEWVEDLRHKALRRAGEYTWLQTAKRTMEIYAEAIGRFHG